MLWFCWPNHINHAWSCFPFLLAHALMCFIHYHKYQNEVKKKKIYENLSSNVRAVDLNPAANILFDFRKPFYIVILFLRKMYLYKYSHFSNPSNANSWWTRVRIYPDLIKSRIVWFCMNKFLPKDPQGILSVEIRRTSNWGS